MAGLACDGWGCVSSTLGEDTAKTDEYEAKRKKIEDVLALDEPPTVKPPEVWGRGSGWGCICM